MGLLYPNDSQGINMGFNASLHVFSTDIQRSSKNLVVSWRNTTRKYDSKMAKGQYFDRVMMSTLVLNFNTIFFTEIYCFCLFFVKNHKSP